MATCDASDNPQTKYECMKTVASEKDIAVEALGALLVTGAKYSYTRSLRGQPQLDSVVKLFANNNASAVSEYAKYVLEKAQNDRQAAADFLVEAQQKDIAAVRQIYADFNQEAEESLAMVRDIERDQFKPQKSLADQASTLRAIKLRVEYLDTEAPLYDKAIEFYPTAAELIGGPLLVEPAMARKVARIRAESQNASRDAITERVRLKNKRNELIRYGLI